MKIKFSLWMMAYLSIIQASMANELLNRIFQYQGFENFEQVQTASYTFRVQFQGKSMARSWSWNPAFDMVHGETPSGPVLYARKNKEGFEKLDSGFINDSYWLFFPYRVKMDSSVSFKSHAKGSLSKEFDVLEIIYPKVGGYTPGDRYVLYIKENGEVAKWQYDHANDGKVERETSWTEYKDFKGLKLPTLFEGEGFRLWFEDVKIVYKTGKK